MSIVFFTFAVTMVSLGAGLLVTFLGIPVLGRRPWPAAAGSARWSGPGPAGCCGLEVADPEPVRGGKTSGLMPWVGAVLKSGASWRHVLYALLHFPWAVFAFCVSLTFWLPAGASLTLPAVALGLPAVRRPAGHPAVRRRHAQLLLDTPSRSP